MARVTWLAPLVVLASAAAVPPRSVPPLFSSYDVVDITLEAPFTDLFAHTKADDDYMVKGKLTYAAGSDRKTFEGVAIGLRGHTSKQDGECTFPKLKLQMPKAAAPDGLFSGVSSVKLGTHCDDSSDPAALSKFGRLLNERSPHREAFVYGLLDLVGVLTLKARPARVTYVYAGAQGQPADRQKPVVRDAFLLEDTDDAVKRAGGKQQVGEKGFTNARDTFTAADTAAIAFAEAMIGNFDWCLKMDPADAYRCNARHPLWNVIAVVGANGRARPLIYDFDVSGMVAGGHRWFADVYNERFLASRSHPAIEVLGQLERTRTLFDRGTLDATRARFTAKRREATDAVKRAPVDEEGRRRIQEYLDAFFATIGSDDAFYRPAAVAPKTMPSADAGGTQAVCPQQDAVPIGTVVSDPLQRTGRMMQVVLLDTRWHWGPDTKCTAVHQAPVWIPQDSVSRDYPAQRPPVGTTGRGRSNR